MRKSTLIAVAIAASALPVGAGPCFSATAANSQNGTESSSAAKTMAPGATEMAPDAAAPEAAAMPMGAGIGTTGAAAPTAGTAPGAGMGGTAGTGSGSAK